MNWTNDAPRSGNPAQPRTTHGTTQPPELPQCGFQRTEHRIDADLIESIMVDPRVRIDLFLDESDWPVLPLSRKVFREAVACGLLNLVRDAAGQVVKMENSQPHQELSIEAFAAFDAMFGSAAQDDFMIGSPYPVTGNPGGDSDVNWAAAFNNDSLNLAERGETMQGALAMLAGDQGANTHTFVYGPGPASHQYGGGSTAAQH